MASCLISYAQGQIFLFRPSTKIQCGRAGCALYTGTSLDTSNKYQQKESVHIQIMKLLFLRNVLLKLIYWFSKWSLCDSKARTPWLRCKWHESEWTECDELRSGYDSFTGPCKQGKEWSLKGEISQVEQPSDPQKGIWSLNLCFKSKCNKSVALWRGYINITMTIMDILHHPVSNSKQSFGDWMLSLSSGGTCWVSEDKLVLSNNKAIMGPSTQQFFFSFSDVIATTLPQLFQAVCLTAIAVSWICNHELCLPLQSLIMVTVVTLVACV
jgi:hypothetical protein